MILGVVNPRGVLDEFLGGYIVDQVARWYLLLVEVIAMMGI